MPGALPGIVGDALTSLTSASGSRCGRSSTSVVENGDQLPLLRCNWIKQHQAIRAHCPASPHHIDVVGLGIRGADAEDPRRHSQRAATAASAPVQRDQATPDDLGALPSIVRTTSMSAISASGCRRGRPPTSLAKSGDQPTFLCNWIKQHRRIRAHCRASSAPHRCRRPRHQSADAEDPRYRLRRTAAGALLHRRSRTRQHRMTCGGLHDIANTASTSSTSVSGVLAWPPLDVAHDETSTRSACPALPLA